MFSFAEPHARHCEERSDAAIQSHEFGKNWIASSQGLLAMTAAEILPFFGQ
jgi:hypothetical protein